MTREEYLAYVEDILEKLIKESKFENNKKQLFAIQLNASFEPTYSEDYFWDHAIQISTCAGIIQKLAGNMNLVVQGFKSAGEAFEVLGNTQNKFDKHYCLILSALCYDLSGYQANAYCLLRNFPDYRLVPPTDTDFDISGDNFILSQTVHILSKQIPLANQLLNNKLDGSNGLILFKNALSAWFKNILNGEETDYLPLMDETYLYYLNEGNVYISQIIFLLRERSRVYLKRSLWLNLLGKFEIESEELWRKYLKLLTNDFYKAGNIKDIKDRHSKFEFWTSQLRAIEGGLMKDESNFVVQMPTSAGKTFIAELAILDHLLKYPDKRCIYIAPFRTLTSEKEIELSEYLSKLGFSVSALSGSYEIDEFEQIILDDTDVLISTPEKLDVLLRINPEYFSSVSLLIIDEGHIIGDVSARASLLEFLIIRLRIQIKNLRTIFISAVMPPENADEYSIWLNGSPDKVLRSKLYNEQGSEDWEPTRKLIGRFDWYANNNGTILYPTLSTNEGRQNSQAFVPNFLRKNQYTGYPLNTKAKTTAALAFKFALSGNTFVYIAQVRYISSVVEALLQVININREIGNDTSFFDQDIKQSHFYAQKWYGDESYVTRALSAGIGIHYGDMPEPVRKAVEADYISGKLRVLLATNTIGQGVNLPIKNIIIHSTILNSSENGAVYISVRDFWNLIGRAGRAGKETEGQIVFVVNSYTDGEQFTRLTNKGNVEEAKSIIFQMLDALVSRRISKSVFTNNMNILSEPYILSLLAEEVDEDEIDRIVDEIISNSLFNIQARQRMIDVDEARIYFNTAFKTLKEELSPDQLNAFASTGLNRASNALFLGVIDENLEDLKTHINNDDFEEILKIIFEIYEQGPDEFISYKLNNLKVTPIMIYELALDWIYGEDVEVLRDTWEEINDNPEGLFVVLSDCFYYRYCWGVTSFLNLLCYRLGIEISTLPDNIKHLASFIKYGINDPTACLARSIGIKNRDVAVQLADRANGTTGKSFLKWLANIELNNLEAWLPTVYDITNLREVVNKLTPERKLIQNVFDFEVVGIYQNDSRKELSLNVQVGDYITYERELDNANDPMAIKILVDEKLLGYVPRQYAKIISVNIDLNDIEYDIVVTDWEEEEDYDKIFVRMFPI